MGLFDRFKKAKVVPLPQKAMETVTDDLIKILGARRLAEDRVAIDKYNIEIQPQIENVDNKSAVIYFIITSLEWERDMRECCAAMGRDWQTAVGMAMSSFMFSFMDGIQKMKQKEAPRAIKTAFAGREHSWKVYLSDVAGMGSLKNQRDDTATMYWELLCEDIKKRLGNQRVCTVKIYCAKAGGQITGECRIDDTVSPELSQKLADFVKDWDVEGFASQKQFIFIEQDKETFIPHKYHNPVHNANFREKVKTCMLCFAAADTEERYNALPEFMAEQTGDKILAWECFSFLPELLAMQAADEDVEFSDKCEITAGDKNFGEIYTHALAEFYPLKDTAWSLLDEGVFGESTKDVFYGIVGTSSICNALGEAKKKGMKKIKFTALKFNLGEDFELR